MAGAGAKLRTKMEPEPKINNFNSATLEKNGTLKKSCIFFFFFIPVSIVLNFQQADEFQVCDNYIFADRDPLISFPTRSRSPYLLYRLVPVSEKKF